MSVPSYFRAQDLWDAGQFDEAFEEAKRHVTYVDQKTDLGRARARSVDLCKRFRALGKTSQTTLIPAEAGVAILDPDVIRPFDGESGQIRKIAVVLVGRKSGISYDAMIDEVVRLTGGDPRADRSDPYRTKVCSAISTGEKRLGLFRRNDADCWWLTEFGSSFMPR